MHVGISERKGTTSFFTKPVFSKKRGPVFTKNGPSLFAEKRAHLFLLNLEVYSVIQSICRTLHGLWLLFLYLVCSCKSLRSLMLLLLYLYVVFSCLLTIVGVARLVAHLVLSMLTT